MQKYTLYNLKVEMPYYPALSLQDLAVLSITNSNADDYLILLRHNPTITLGKFAKEEDILKSKKFLEKKGIEVCETDRGGGVTYHGPGQLVGYPIIDAYRKNLPDYKSPLCKTIIDLLKDYGIEAEEEFGSLSGVWVKKKKIAAIGYAMKRFHSKGKTNVITTHGFALYVLNDMKNFKYINPCGVSGMKLTNMEKILKRKVDFEELKEKYVKHFEKVFEYEPIEKKNLND